MSNAETQQSLHTLIDDVRTALKQWHGDTNSPSPLRHLYLFRQIARERHSRGLLGERGVTNQVLRNAITRLEETHETDAELIQYRHLDVWPIQRLANHYNVADSTVYNMQASAVERLADTLGQMELDAVAKQQRSLTARLEPSTYTKLVGAEGHIQQLQQQLLQAGPPWLISLEGIGGIGKTSLADFTIRHLIQQGQIDEVGWVTARQVRFNLGGTIHQKSEPALSASMLIEKLAAQLVPGLTHSANQSMDDLLRALRIRLDTAPHFIVIDNLETVIDVEDLLPTLQALANPTKFILTSRESLRIEPNIFHLKLTELSKCDAFTLARQEAMLSNLPLIAECADEDLAPLIDAVGGNPLALRLTIGQTHIYTLESIVQDLQKAEGETVENLYTFIYRQAWDGLDALARKVLLTMPLVQRDGEPLDYLAKIAKLEVGQVRMVLNKLVLLNLVDARGGVNQRRYTIHSLTSTFLQEQIAKWA